MHILSVHKRNSTRLVFNNRVAGEEMKKFNIFKDSIRLLYFQHIFDFVVSEDEWKSEQKLLKGIQLFPHPAHPNIYSFIHANVEKVGRLW